MTVLTSFLEKLGATIALVLMFFVGLSPYVEANPAFPDIEVSEEFEEQSSTLNSESVDQSVDDIVEYDDEPEDMEENQKFEYESDDEPPDYYSEDEVD
ncbi:hypothetical protein [Endozoicomonas elysicola]|uniref:Uncharacterized protein n=1 Tax=Endozoicomonas elysicola TaxID=305900 RepID=A0A081KF17_9GAMM|nr:hypothetical protein [Endozoicomonas elysicola]KEI72743.1 hypothetical protein GV64_20220 [Endozoicomonas elysicola]